MGDYILMQKEVDALLRGLCSDEEDGRPPCGTAAGRPVGEGTADSVDSNVEFKRFRSAACPSCPLMRLVDSLYQRREEVRSLVEELCSVEQHRRDALDLLRRKA